MREPPAQGSPGDGSGGDQRHLGALRAGRNGRGADPFATLIDIVCNDRLATVLWPSAPDDDEVDEESVEELSYDETEQEEEPFEMRPSSPPVPSACWRT